MGNAFSKIKSSLKAAYFWQRLLVLVVASFLFGISIRLEPRVTAIVLMLVSVLSGLWLVASVFKKKNSPVLGTKPMKPWWVRLIALVTIAPILWISSVGIGSNAALAIKPYTAAEIAENEAREKVELQREEERRAAEKRQQEEQAKLDADKEAAEKAAAEDQAEREAAENSAREETESQNIQQNSGADWDKINKLKNSAPLLYATEFCNQTLILLDVNIYDYVSASDDGTSLFISTQSQNNRGGNLTYACMSDQLDFSNTLEANVGSTSALSGTKTWAENRMDFQWTYHPSNGINMSIVREKECFLLFCN